MSTTRPPSDLTAHYAEYYGSDEFRHWREIGGREKAESVKQLAGHLRPQRIADIGCGDGAVLLWLDRWGIGAEYVGYEISPSAIASAQERSFERPCQFVLFEQKIPAADKTFDLAILSHVVEHVDEPRAVIREAARTASHLLVELPLELHYRTPEHFRWTDVGHINVFNRKSARHLIESCGLTVEAERIYCPSRGTFTFQRGNTGNLRWAVKASALAAVPRIATQIWTYHAAFLASEG